MSSASEMKFLVYDDGDDEDIDFENENFDKESNMFEEFNFTGRDKSQDDIINKEIEDILEKEMSQELLGIIKDEIAEKNNNKLKKHKTAVKIPNVGRIVKKRKTFLGLKTASSHHDHPISSAVNIKSEEETSLVDIETTYHKSDSVVYDDVKNVFDAEFSSNFNQLQVPADIIKTESSVTDTETNEYDQNDSEIGVAMNMVDFSCYEEFTLHHNKCQKSSDSSENKVNSSVKGPKTNCSRKKDSAKHKAKTKQHSKKQKSSSISEDKEDAVSSVVKQETDVHLKANDLLANDLLADEQMESSDEDIDNVGMPSTVSEVDMVAQVETGCSTTSVDSLDISCEVNGRRASPLLPPEDIINEGERNPKIKEFLMEKPSVAPPYKKFTIFSSLNEDPGITEDSSVEFILQLPEGKVMHFIATPKKPLKETEASGEASVEESQTENSFPNDQLRKTGEEELTSQNTELHCKKSFCKIGVHMSTQTNCSGQGYSRLLDSAKNLIILKRKNSTNSHNSLKLRKLLPSSYLHDSTIPVIKDASSGSVKSNKYFTLKTTPINEGIKTFTLNANPVNKGLVTFPLNTNPGPVNNSGNSALNTIIVPTSTVNSSKQFLPLYTTLQPTTFIYVPNVNKSPDIIQKPNVLTTVKPINKNVVQPTYLPVYVPDTNPSLIGKYKAEVGTSIEIINPKVSSGGNIIMNQSDPGIKSVNSFTAPLPDISNTSCVKSNPEVKKPPHFLAQIFSSKKDEHQTNVSILRPDVSSSNNAEPLQFQVVSPKQQPKSILIQNKMVSKRRPGRPRVKAIKPKPVARIMTGGDKNNFPTISPLESDDSDIEILS